jgi:hypothetical protein
MSEQRKEYKIEGRVPTIYRVVKNKDNPYVMIDRRPVDNPALSFKAKGILTYLLSRPDGWEVSVADLIKHGKEKEAAVRSGLKELKNAGHMKYTQSRNQGRITGWLIEVYEIPHSPDGDFQQVENQDVENRGQVLSTLSRKQKQSSIKEGVNAAPKTPHEINLYRTVTKKYPPTPNYEDVITYIQAVSRRLGRDCSADDLRPFYKAWTGNGWNQYSINWLQYAVKGQEPTAKRTAQNNTEPKAFDAIRQWQAMKEQGAYNG